MWIWWRDVPDELGLYAYDGLFADLTLHRTGLRPIDVEGLLPLWNQMTMGSRIVGLPFNGWLGASITYNATLFQEAALPCPPPPGPIPAGTGKPSSMPPETNGPGCC